MLCDINVGGMQLIKDVLPAKTIVDNMIEEAAEILTRGGSLVSGTPKAKL